MDEPKEEKIITWISRLMVCGTCSLLFTLIMHMLNGEVLQVFLRAGIVCLGTALSLIALRMFMRNIPAGKKTERRHQ